MAGPLELETDSLPEQLQDRLRRQVGLSQHRGGRLLQDLELGEVHHLLRHVHVADAGLGRLQVLGRSA